MLRALLSIVFNAVALYATALVVPGITFHGGVVSLLVAGAIFGLFNLIVRPVAMILSIPLLIVSLGLFYFVLNGILLWLAAFFLPHYNVSGVMAGILGSLVFTIVNWALHALFGPSEPDPRTDK
jgi:putative membrane protein